MKKYIFTVVAAVLCLASCQPFSNEMDPDYPTDYQINYTLKQVMEYDPVNVNGIDVYKYFDFFSTLNFTINVVDSKMTSLVFDRGDIPFSPFQFDIPEGEVECWLDSESIPNALRVKGTDDVVAYYKNGQIVMDFQLDCKEISYEFRFKEVK